MARSRLGGPPRRVNSFENRRFAAAKEIANARRRDNKSNFFYHNVKILMWKYVGMLSEKWELEDV